MPSFIKASSRIEICTGTENFPSLRLSKNLSLRASAHTGVVTEGNAHGAIRPPKCFVFIKFSDKPSLFRERIPTVACVIVRLPPAIVHLDSLRYAPSE